MMLLRLSMLEQDLFYLNREEFAQVWPLIGRAIHIVAKAKKRGDRNALGKTIRYEEERIGEEQEL